MRVDNTDSIDVVKKLAEHHAKRRQGFVPDHKGHPVLRERTFNIPIDDATDVPPLHLFKFVEADLPIIQGLMESDDLRTTFAQSGAYYRDMPDLLIACIGMYNMMQEMGLTRELDITDKLYQERYAFLMNAMHVANREWEIKYNKGVREAKQKLSARNTRLKKKMNQLAKPKK